MNANMTPIALLLASLSTGLMAAESTNIGEVRVQGTGSLGAGKMAQEETPKARSSVSKEAIKEKAPTANTFQLIDKLPGVNTQSQSASGLSGGTLTVRGFNSSQMGFTVDGMPVNDSGSYEVYPQEYVDAENLEEVYITQGTTDNDAPHTGATGGNIGVITSNPYDKFGVRYTQTLGDNNMFKTFLRLDTGKLGPVATFLSVSRAGEDKWRGAGEIKRDHVTLKSVARLGALGQMTFGIDWNKQENHFLRRARMSDFLTFGRDYDYLQTFVERRAPGAGSQDDSRDNRTNYYQLAQNPFENAQITGKANFNLTSGLSLDFEPYFWHGLGGGSSAQTLRESDFTKNGRDLNGDGDKSDIQLFYRLSKTQTYRPGATLRLNWQIGDHRIKTGIWYERARHRQTQPYVGVDRFGNPLDIWADSNLVLRNDGQILQGAGRNWHTVTEATQFFIEDSFAFGDKWNFQLGLRTPKTERKGIDYGSGAEGSSTDTFRTLTKTWDAILPNISAKYLLDDQSHVFAALSKNHRTPQNFILFERDTAGNPRELNPEQTINLDIGYRYQGEMFNFNGSVFTSNFKDRQAQRQDDDGTRRNYNVGDVRTRGLELEVATRPVHGFSTYASLSYTRSKQLNDFVTRGQKTIQVPDPKDPKKTISQTVFEQVAIPTAGMDMVDTPRWMGSAGVNYQNGGWSFGFSGKYTDERWGDLMNTEKTPSFTVWDLNLGYRFKGGSWFKNMSVKANISNLFDKVYLGGIPSTSTNAKAYVNANGYSVSSFAPNYDIGQGRYTSLVFEANF